MAKTQLLIALAIQLLGAVVVGEDWHGVSFLYYLLDLSGSWDALCTKFQTNLHRSTFQT